MICQSDRFPEMFMISQTPKIGGTSKHIRQEEECGQNSPTYLGEFCKALPTQNQIFQNLPKLL